MVPFLKRAVIIAAIFLTVCMAFVLLSPMASANEQPLTGSLTFNWQNPPGTLTGSMVDYTPGSNYTKTMNMHLTFSLGNISEIKPEEIEIRIPQSIFRNREDEITGNFYIPLPKYPETGQVSSFNYKIDTDTDEIVITNFETIKDTLAFKLDVQYSFLPENVKDGYINEDIKATATVKSQGEEIFKTESNVSGVTIHTWVKLSYVNKWIEDQFAEWNPKWGDAPENAENYFYVVWRVGYGSSYTQPFKPYIEDRFENSEFVGWTTSNYSNFNVQFTLESWEEFSKKPYGRQYIMTKHLKPPAGETITFKNTATIKLMGIDGAQVEDSDTEEGTFPEEEPPDPPYVYAGDRIYTGKSFDKSEYYGASECMKRNYSFDVSFDIWSKIYIWDKVNNKETGEVGTRNCLVEWTDDKFTIGETLEPGSYSFNKIKLDVFYCENQWIEEGDLHHTSPNLRSFSVYCKNGITGKWALFSNGKFDRGKFTFFDVNGNIISEGKELTLSEGCTGIKISTSTKCQYVWLRMTVYSTIYPTEQTKRIFQAEPEQKLTNNVTTKATDDKGGELVDIDRASTRLLELKYSSYFDKFSGYRGADISLGANKYRYVLNLRTYISCDSNDLIIKDKLYQKISEGTFYDLIPKGMIVDLSSIRLATQTNMVASFPRDSYRVSLISNWRDSGQQMLIVDFKVPSGYNSYSLKSSSVAMEFYATDSWVNIMDNGPISTNYAGYYNIEGTLRGEDVYNDDTSDLANNDPKWQYLTDLNSDGNTGEEQTMYDKDTTTHTGLMAAQYGFSKKVKSPEDRIYAQSTEVSAGGIYDYQLRFMTEKNAEAKNLIIYDEIENGYGENPFWKGTFKYVDVSQPVSKGIAPVVYYSTVPKLNLSNNSGNRDLNNSKVWSKTPPKNLEDLTALAIDLRKNKDGTDYEMGEEESVYCNIGMIAPTNYIEYIDPIVYAYNDALINVCITQNEQVKEIVEPCLPVKVEIKEPDLDINKVSNPASGTESEPADLNIDGSIDYTVTLINKSKNQSYQNVTITDTIPNPLVADINNIEYYFGNNVSSKKLLSTNNNASVNLDNNGKLEINLKMVGVSETINFIIPAKGKDYSPLIKNTAHITKINGKECTIESDSTYHKWTKKPMLPETGGRFNKGMWYGTGGILLLVSSIFLVIIARKKRK